jgi:hypothetical protein
MPFTKFYKLLLVRNIIISLSIIMNLIFVIQEHMDYINKEFNDLVNDLFINGIIFMFK